MPRPWPLCIACGMATALRTMVVAATVAAAAAARRAAARHRVATRPRAAANLRAVLRPPAAASRRAALRPQLLRPEVLPSPVQALLPQDVALRQAVVLCAGLLRVRAASRAAAALRPPAAAAAAKPRHTSLGQSTRQVPQPQVRACGFFSRLDRDASRLGVPTGQIGGVP